MDGAREYNAKCQSEKGKFHDFTHVEFKKTNEQKKKKRERQTMKQTQLQRTAWWLSNRK